jgi:hypothetical protein
MSKRHYEKFAPIGSLIKYNNQNIFAIALFNDGLSTILYVLGSGGETAYNSKWGDRIIVAGA